jgi:hypothetical protein
VVILLPPLSGVKNEIFGGFQKNEILGIFEKTKF